MSGSRAAVSSECTSLPKVNRDIGFNSLALSHTISLSLSLSLCVLPVHVYIILACSDSSLHLSLCLFFMAIYVYIVPSIPHVSLFIVSIYFSNVLPLSVCLSICLLFSDAHCFYLFSYIHRICFSLYISLYISRSFSYIHINMYILIYMYPLYLLYLLCLYMYTAACTLPTLAGLWCIWRKMVSLGWVHNVPGGEMLLFCSAVLSLLQCGTIFYSAILSLLQCGSISSAVRYYLFCSAVLRLCSPSWYTVLTHPMYSVLIHRSWQCCCGPRSNLSSIPT